MLLFFVAIFNTTVYFVLRSAFTPLTHHTIMTNSEQKTESSINADYKGVVARTVPSERKNLMDPTNAQSQQNSVVITKCELANAIFEYQAYLVTISFDLSLKESRGYGECKPYSIFVFSACGGIMTIPRNSKGYIVDQHGVFERCAWIIKSETKKIKVRYANQSLGGSSGTIIGELREGDESLSCHNL